MKNKKDFFITFLIICVCFIFLRAKGSPPPGIMKEEAMQMISALNLPSSENQKTIILFSTSWCGVCRNLENSLRISNLAYHSFDIEKSVVGRKIYEEIIGQSSGPVPLTLVGRQIFLGNQASKIAQSARALN